MLKKPANPPNQGKSSKTADPENGYLLIGALFLVAVVLITLAVAAPQVASEIQRDKELELYHRGLQYQHAIRLYYKKFGRYPSNLEQLEKTNEIRFLRKRYKDPVTGKDEWRMIHFGEQKVKTTGLFGQPIAATGTTDYLHPAQLKTARAEARSAAHLLPRSDRTRALHLAQTPALHLARIPVRHLARPEALLRPSVVRQEPQHQRQEPEPPRRVRIPRQPVLLEVPMPGAAGGTNTGIAGASTSGISSIGSGQTFGGGGIVGVSSGSKKSSIREYKKQKHYNEWEFVYDPASELNGMAGAAGAGQQPGNPNQNGTFGSGGFGSSSGSGGFGSNSPSGGFGSSNSPTGTSQPTPPTQPTTPTPQQ